MTEPDAATFYAELQEGIRDFENRNRPIFQALMEENGRRVMAMFEGCTCETMFSLDPECQAPHNRKRNKK